MEEVGFGRNGRAWNIRNFSWLDWNGLEWRKSVLVSLAWLGVSEVGFDCCWVESMTRRVMIRFFFVFLWEKEKTRVFDKDLRAEARCDSLPEKRNIVRKEIE
jgi:hypothetical protein